MTPQRTWLSTIAAGLVVIVGAHAIAQEVELPVKSVEIRHTDIIPKIDGVIEEVWQAADSATGFRQLQPYEKSEPTEPTIVYLLQDEHNLYAAFRCYSLKHPPTANLTKDEDYVSISLDPFGSKTTGYFFLLYASGIFWDGLVLDDGRDMDLSWEGVWYRANKIYPDRMDVEMKIPFKTIRYKEGLSEWGVQFMRHIAANVEDDLWTEVTQKEGDMVSRWGTARGLAPQVSGYYFELYPEGYIRRDDFLGQESELKPKGSLNLKWDLTPQTSLNATAYPDFAQIESDPVTINLSRYPTYLGEQRPFFIEGMEIFHIPGFPGSGFFQPLEIFYSRRIGKSVDGEVIPIIGGLKLTHKTQDWDLGVLSAYTDDYKSLVEGVDEPSRLFSVIRAKRRVLGSSDVGILASGTSAGKDNYNYAIGADAVVRDGANQFIAQSAMSNRNGKQGLAVSTGYRGFNKGLLTLASYSAIDDSFDVSDIGFVPWAGAQQATLITGPYWTFQNGALRDLYVAGGILRNRDPGSPHWSTLGHFMINPHLRNRWGCNLEMTYGRNYEYNDVSGEYVGYTGRNLSFNINGMLRGNNVNAGCSYSYSYNYSRHYLAYQGANYLSASYSFVPPLSATLTSNLWVEWDPDNNVVAMWPRLRPRIDYRITSYMTLSIFDEMVSYTPQTHLGQTRLQSNRVGLIYSWNFAPKSWIYVALNDLSALDYSEHPGGEMTEQYDIAAVKLKYLLYF